MLEAWKPGIEVSFRNHILEFTSRSHGATESDYTRKEKEQKFLHGSVCTSEPPRLVGGEVARRRAGRLAVEVDERVPHGVPERVADGAAALVPDGALVESRRPAAAADPGGEGGGGARGEQPTEEGVDGQEEGEGEGGEARGDDGAQQTQSFHRRFLVAAKRPCRRPISWLLRRVLDRRIDRWPDHFRPFP